ncbi:hypothetical protein KOR42_49970 [Thalassoglobus neptunius]|uniref:Uncharacterized protein n=1 Tax=Thalassoglobus neptunius TaxID=1938619 RepID=A0A5C5VRB8_9PLAN|nr:hypothetical protein [Thalassoglobus neptunius]TWT40102.1 hypothetical protein KOR42_49970 [Thalassoglobus neptunius]
MSGRFPLPMFPKLGRLDPGLVLGVEGRVDGFNPPLGRLGIDGRLGLGREAVGRSNDGRDDPDPDPKLGREGLGRDEPGRDGLGRLGLGRLTDGRLILGRLPPLLGRLLLGRLPLPPPSFGVLGREDGRDPPPPSRLEPPPPRELPERLLPPRELELPPRLPPPPRIPIAYNSDVENVSITKAASAAIDLLFENMLSAP